MLIIDVLVMMRSGREYRLGLYPAQVEELKDHADIGPGRVHVIGLSQKTEPDVIPWNRMFPGVKLYRTQAEVPPKPRAYTRKDKSRVTFAAEPLGIMTFVTPKSLQEASVKAPFWQI